MTHLFDIDDVPFRDFDYQQEEWEAFLEDAEREIRDREIRMEDRHGARLRAVRVQTPSEHPAGVPFLRKTSEGRRRG